LTSSFGIALKSRKDLNRLYAQEIKSYNDSCESETLYEGGFLIKGKAFNYLNSKSSHFALQVFRPMINKIFEDLEALYPTAGEIFLDIVMRELKNITLSTSDDMLYYIDKRFDKLIDKVKKTSSHVHKSHYENFLKSEISEKNLDFISSIIENINITTKIFVEKGMINKTVIKKTDDISFDIKFDTDFLLGMKTWQAKDYNFIIIDGYIDSVGEIHHLLQAASETKEPYVIFCKGMDISVKDVILQNLMRGTINIMPISLEINELNLNILSDVAKCHESDIVNSLMGETISIAVRRKLEKGKKIIVGNGYFIVDPKAKDEKINLHLKYLERRKLESNIQANTDILDERIKIMSADKVNIRLGLTHIKDKTCVNDLKKILYFLKNAMTGLSHVKNIELFSNHAKLIPTNAALTILNSSSSFLKIIYNTRAALIIEKS
jgi:hypothetical protein